MTRDLMILADVVERASPRVDDDAGDSAADLAAAAVALRTLAASQHDCYHRAKLGEPKFTLLGRDPCAAVLVNLWAVMRRIEADPTDEVKIAEAEGIANDMAMWVQFHRGRDPVGAAGLAVATAAFAEMVGAVITMTQEPLEPLAMGHYRHTVTVRAKREAAEPIVREVVADEGMTPREVLASRLIDSWCETNSGQIPWAKAVEITAITTGMSDAERDRLLALNDV